MTARGKKIYEASLALMKSLDQFRYEVNTTTDVMTGELNIGLVDNIIWDKEAGLSEVFRNFSSIASEVDLTLYVLSPDEIERRLIDVRVNHRSDVRREMARERVAHAAGRPGKQN